MRQKIVLMLILISTPATLLFAAGEQWIEDIIGLLPSWSTQPFMSLTIWQWIGMAGAVLLGLIIRKMVSLLMKGLHRIALSRNSSEWDDLIIEAFMGPTGTLSAIGIWYLSVSVLRLNEGVAGALGTLLQVLLYITLITLAYRLTNVLIFFLRNVTSKTDSDLDDQLMPIIEKTLRILVVTFGTMIALQNLGVNVVSALAGLGIGGLAFALAAKDTAANIFGSFTIFMDQPFKMGDWVKINGSHEGIVEAIGIRTTRIRTFAKTLISLPNSVVANSSIENYSARPYRRIYTKIGITYGTPSEKVEAMVQEIRAIIKENSFATEEGMQVSFMEYASSSLNIMVYFFVKVADWTEELQAKQDVYLAIMRSAEKLGIEFAFPTQTIHVESMPQQ